MLWLRQTTISKCREVTLIQPFKPETDVLDKRIKHWNIVDAGLPANIRRSKIGEVIKVFTSEFKLERNATIILIYSILSILYTQG